VDFQFRLGLGIRGAGACCAEVFDVADCLVEEVDDGLS
jgi:hypothetical protein